MQVLQGMYNYHTKCKSSINSFFFPAGSKTKLFLKALIKCLEEEIWKYIDLAKMHFALIVLSG